MISNSDCHSPAKLGREANLLATGFDFGSLREAFRANCRDTFPGTVEFFPEEGKYHFDGHLACKVCLDPAETRRLGEACPVCGRPVTVGVHHRVLALADREEPLYPASAPEFFSLIPLGEMIGELLGAGPATKGVMECYATALSLFGPELELLLRTPLEEISRHSPLLAEAIGRVRGGKVHRQPGYDGQYGVIRAFAAGELSGGKRKKGDLFPR
jgi:PHP family Zn ribbon phosphoesterase